MNEISGYGEYIKHLEDNGYISSRDSMPIKCCQCDSTSLKEVDESYEMLGGSYCKTDSRIVCKDCNSELGYYSYGQWFV